MNQDTQKSVNSINDSVAEEAAGRAVERDEVLAKARAAKGVAPVFAQLDTAQKNQILHDAAAALETNVDAILSANEKDIAAGKERGMSDSLIDRLRLDADRVSGIAGGLRQVAGLQDPVGAVIDGGVMGNGIEMKKVRVPLGVMGMVYEARPNVTVDAFGLALKSGNVPLLRGSKSAKESNAALVSILQDVLAQHDLPREGVQLLPCESHDSVQDLITARGLVDVVIPRGGARLIEAVVLVRPFRRLRLVPVTVTSILMLLRIWTVLSKWLLTARLAVRPCAMPPSAYCWMRRFRTSISLRKCKRCREQE